MKFALWRGKKNKKTTAPADHRVTYPLGPIDHRAEHNARVLKAGWIFLGAVVVLTIAAILIFLPKREKRPADTPGANSPAAAVSAEEKTGKKGKNHDPNALGGQNVRIRSLDCDFTPPAELSVGIVRSVDLSALAETAAANVGAAGWGEVGYSLSADGSLLLYAKNAVPLNAADYEKQDAFLASSQPENMARTFLQDSGIIELLRPYGITLSTTAENNKGEILFRGSGEDAQEECSIRFSFLFTGAFNQAKLRAVYLDNALTTDQIVPIKKAASTAISWSSSGEEETSVTAAEIRSIRGIPFYVFLCDDGTSAYSLAVNESVLAALPEARAVYDEIMDSGIQEYIEQPGAA